MILLFFIFDVFWFFKIESDEGVIVVELNLSVSIEGVSFVVGEW